MTIEERKMDIIRAFNNKPKDAIKIVRDICDKNQLNMSEQLAGLFFEERKNLDMASIGDYLSGPDPEQIETLKYFTGKLDFKDKHFVGALRDYLQCFKLPGEAQKIDRVTEAFAREYGVQNKNMNNIANQDAAYILTFQAIMLNTDLHNPSVKNKMTLDGLKKNLKGCNGNGDFPEKFLKEFYDELQERPFKLDLTPGKSSYVLHDKKLNEDRTFSDLDKLLKDDKLDNGDIFERLDMKANGLTVNIDEPKTFLKRFTGYQGEMTIFGKDQEAKVRVQVYMPSIFSKWFLNDKPKLLIQPAAEPGKEPTSENIKIAAKIAASFDVPLKNIDTIYEYLKTDLKNAYIENKTNEIAKSLREGLKRRNSATSVSHEAKQAKKSTFVR